MDTIREPVTNGEFARRVGVHFTMASRYRNGRRVPSTTVLHKIAGEFGLPIDELVEAATTSGEEFGRYMRARLFGIDPDSENGQYTPQEVTTPCPTQPSAV